MTKEKFLSALKEFLKTILPSLVLFIETIFFTGCGSISAHLGDFDFQTKPVSEVIND